MIFGIAKQSEPFSERRKAAARAIADLKREHKEGAKQRAQASRAAEKRHLAALQELNAATANMVALKREDMAASHALAVAIRPHEEIMRETAGGVLAPFLTRTHQERRRLQDSPTEDIVKIQREFVGYREGRPVYESITNLDQLSARISRLREIEEEAKRLAITKEDLSEADLDQLWHSLPSEHMAGAN